VPATNNNDKKEDKKVTLMPVTS